MSLVQLVATTAVVFAPCPYMSAETSCYEPRQNAIYLAAGWNRDTYFHEYGHAYDYNVLTDAQRDRVKRLLGYSASTNWWTETAYRLAPAEAFANAYSDCARGTWVRIRKVCALLPRSAYAVWLVRAATRRS